MALIYNQRFSLFLLFSILLLFIIITDIMLGKWYLFTFVAGILAAPTKQPMNSKPLRFTSEGTFQIAIFEDLHFGEGPETDWGPAHVYNHPIQTTHPNTDALDRMNVPPWS